MLIDGLMPGQLANEKTTGYLTCEV